MDKMKKYIALYIEKFRHWWVWHQLLDQQRAGELPEGRSPALDELERQHPDIWKVDGYHAFPLISLLWELRPQRGWLERWHWRQRYYRLGREQGTMGWDTAKLIRAQNPGKEKQINYALSIIPELVVLKNCYLKFYYIRILWWKVTEWLKQRSAKPPHANDFLKENRARHGDIGFPVIPPDKEEPPPRTRN